MQSGDGLVLIYTTFETAEQARSAGSVLVDERLAACVNILPGMVAIYEWQGRRCEAGEAVMIIKTREGLIDDALEKLKAIHPYDTPALVVLDPARVDPAFNAWIVAQTSV